MRKHCLLIILSLICCHSPAQANRSSADCGSSDTILQRYVSAVGGEAALSGLNTLRIEASATEPHTFNPSSTAHYHYRFEWKTPGKLRVRQHYMLTFANWIFDGEGWSLWNGKISHNDDNLPEWRRKLRVFPYNDSPEFLMFRVVADPLLVATTKDLYRGYANFDNEPGTCVLEAFGRSEWGRRRDRLTFDAESGLLKIWTIEASPPGEKTYVQFEFDDYQQSGPVMIPRSIYFDFYKTQFRITKVVLNVPIEDTELVPRP